VNAAKAEKKIRMKQAEIKASKMVLNFFLMVGQQPSFV